MSDDLLDNEISTEKFCFYMNEMEPNLWNDIYVHRMTCCVMRWLPPKRVANSMIRLQAASYRLVAQKLITFPYLDITFVHV